MGSDAVVINVTIFVKYVRGSFTSRTSQALGFPSVGFGAIVFINRDEGTCSASYRTHYETVQSE